MTPVHMDPFLMSVLGLTLAAVVGFGWRVNSITRELREIMSSHNKDIHKKIDEHERHDVDRFERITVNTGELGYSLNERIRQAELWGRDNYLLEKHFNLRIQGIHDTLSGMCKEANAQYLNLQSRLIVIERNGKDKPHE